MYRGKRSRHRAATPAQIAASQKAWDEAAGTVTGRFSKGQVVRDYQGQWWRITRPGRRYHEDVGDAIYPVVPARAPREGKAWTELEVICERVAGQHADAAFPAADTKRLVLREPGRLAGGWEISTAGDVVSCYRSVYDDAPVTGRVVDARLAARVRNLIPVARYTAVTHVTLRQKKPAAQLDAEIAEALAKEKP